MFTKSGEGKWGKSTDFLKLLLHFVLQIGKGNNLILKNSYSEKAVTVQHICGKYSYRTFQLFQTKLTLKII